MSKIDELLRELMTKWREAIFGSLCILEKDSRAYQFCESIREDLCIRFSDIFPDFCECRCTIINRLENKEYPLLAKKCEESLGMWTSTLWRSYHIIFY